MRFAVIPLIPTSRYVLSESDFLVYSHLIEHAEMERRGYFYYMLTEGQKPYVQRWSRSNVTYLYVKEQSAFYWQQSSVPAEFLDFFNPLVGTYYVDCILTSRSGAAALMAKLLWDKRVKEPEIAIAIIEPKVIEWESTHNAVCPQDLILRAAGYAVSCNLFSTDRECKLAEKLCKEYLSSAMAYRAMKNSHAIPLGIRCDEIDQFVKDRGLYGSDAKFKLFFGGRLTANKQWQKVLGDYEKFFSFGRDIDLIVCAPLGSTSMFKAQRWGTWGEINLGLPRETYLERLVTCHVSMSNSIEEGFTVGIVEQIYAGLVVLLPDREWARSLLGSAAADYPFFYSGGHQDAYVALKYVFENYDEARAKMEPTRQYIKKHYDFSIVSKQTFGVIEKYISELHERVKRSESKEFKNLVDRIIDISDKPIAFPGFLKKVKDYTTADVTGAERNYRSGYPSEWQVYQFLRQRGYEDDYRFASPRLMKDGEIDAAPSS